MMQTRCPACGTAFHVTPEQMRFKGGKVRCGHCRVVFNALAYLMVKVPSTTKASLLDPLDFLPDDPTPPIVAPLQPARQAMAPVAEEPVVTEEVAPSPDSLLPAPPEPALEPPIEPPASPAPAPEAAPILPPKPAPVATSRLSDPIDEIAGTTPWVERPPEDTSNEPALWPFYIVVTLLLIALGAQLIYQFRTDVLIAVPGLKSVFQELNIDVPPPRHVELVTIDTSDLQADASHKQLNLQAILVNKAPYAQAWPLIELTLTDTQDVVIARRVFEAQEYLGRKALTPLFPARQDLSIRLFIDSENLNPAGYRLYVFYP